MTGLLQGVRVLDLTNVIAGPLCSYYLALMGAEVIKVEVPGTGDLARKMGSDPQLGKRQMGASFLAMNGGKKSITLNLKSPVGRELFCRMVRTADVVLENFRPGTMVRLGLDHDTLRTFNPKLVYCAVSGFGQQGPLAGRASYDQIIQSMCGLMSVTGTQETAPTRAGFVVCDTTAAITASFAIAAALFRRDRTGEGEMIDVSMLDSALTSMASWPISNYLNAGREPRPLGNHNPTSAPSGTFPTADAPITIVNNEQKQFAALCDAIDLPHLKSDPRFAARDDRLNNREALHEILEGRLRELGAAEWDARMEAAGVPVGLVLTVPQVLDHPQVRMRGLVQEVASPSLDRTLKLTGAGFQLGGQPVPIPGPPPELGEHTDALLQEFGCTKAEIAAFRAEGII